MKDPYRRIARWFTLLAEYDFEIYYWSGRGNACAEFLSRPAELTVIDDHQPLESNLKAIAHYLDNLSIVHESISITPDVKMKAKDFLVHDGRLFRRTKYGDPFRAPYKNVQSIVERVARYSRALGLQFKILVCERLFLVAQYATRSSELREEL